ncbi:MAG TPA: hypothetical protein VHW71_00535 [Steroidobacteraceae bacterium]|nr:hypothetical protein [Steroidobacteraceae bacterium]
MAQLQAVDHGIAKRADADLQRAAVAHQTGAIQADCMVGRAQALIGGREQIVLIAGVFDQRVEGFRRHSRRPEHERHLSIDLADDHDLPPRLPLRRQMREQVQGDIGIRPKAVFAAALDTAFCDQLCDDVDPPGGNIARNMRVIAADIVALRMCNAEQCARLQEKLYDLHIVGYTGAMQIGEVIERHIGPEQPDHQRLEEAPLQLALPPGRSQAQGGEDRER